MSSDAIDIKPLLSVVYIVREYIIPYNTSPVKVYFKIMYNIFCGTSQVIFILTFNIDSNRIFIILNDYEKSDIMEIIVRKPTPEEKAMMQKQPTWSCEVSEFDWFYSSMETCLIIEGQVTVSYDGGSVSFGAGDFVVLPKGLSCVWKVSEAVKKYYLFK